MKKRLLLGLSTMFALVLCFAVLCACGGSALNGKYYLYQDGKTYETSWVEISGDKWKNSSGESGKCKIEGNQIAIYSEVFGTEQITARGTVEDGVLTIREGIAKWTYCKEGVTPSDSSQSSDNTNNPNNPSNPSTPNTPSNPSTPSTEKVTITYNANGGKFLNGSETYSQSANKDALLTAPDSPNRTNYTFAGWSKDKLGSNMWKFDEDKATGGTTLYAQWAEKSAVILSVDGASIEGNSIFMLVNNTTDAVSLSNKVVCSSDSIWRLYYDRLCILYKSPSPLDKG